MKFIRTTNGNILNINHLGGFYIKNVYRDTVDKKGNIIRNKRFYEIFCWMNDMTLKKEAKHFSVRQFESREMAESYLEALLTELNK